MQMSMIRRALFVGLAIAVVQVSTPQPASAQLKSAVTARGSSTRSNVRKPLWKRIFNRRTLKMAGAAVVAGAVALTPIMSSAAPVEIRDGRSHVTYGEMLRDRSGQPVIFSAARGDNLGRMDESGGRVNSPVQRFGRQEQAQIVIRPSQLERAGLSVKVLGGGNPEMVRRVPKKVDPSGLTVIIRGGKELRGPEIFSYRGDIHGAALRLGGDQVLGTVAGRTSAGVNIFTSSGQPVFVNTGGQVSR
jgi:hypothetical protein